MVRSVGTHAVSDGYQPNRSVQSHLYSGEEDGDIVNGITEHGEVVPGCFGDDVHPLGFHRHTDACSDLLLALESASKGVEANLNDIFSTTKSQ
jgi:hypothetical protein